MKKIVLALVLMLGMATAPVRAINVGDLVKRAFCIAGATGCGWIAVASELQSFKFARLYREFYDDKIASKDAAANMRWWGGTGLLTSASTWLLFYLGLKK